MRINRNQSCKYLGGVAVMPKKITAETDVRILEEIGRHAEGIGMDTLHAYVEDAIIGEACSAVLPCS